MKILSTFNVRLIVLLCFSAACISFLSIYCRSEDSVGLKTNDKMSKNLVTNYELVLRVWIEEANSHDLDKEPIKLVCDLFKQIVKPEDCGCNVDEEELKKAIGRYLEQFEYTFTGKNSEGACYWMAWLLGQSATRSQDYSKTEKETLAWFQNFFTNEIIHALDINAKEMMGEDDYVKYHAQIGKALGWTEEMLQLYFNELYDDPLFPVLKKTASNYTQEKVLEHVLKDSVLKARLQQRIKLMVLEEEFITQQLENHFKTAPKKVMFWLTLYETKQELLKPEYWGGMGHIASSSGTGIWPIEMFVERINRENDVLDD